MGPALIALPEDQWFDRKSARIAPRELANVLIGFANAEGGVVVIGLADGTVEGTAARRAQLNDLQQASVEFSVPPVRAVGRRVPCRLPGGARDELLVLEVGPGTEVHANRRDEAYLRIGDQNHRLTFAQRQELVFDKQQTGYESRPVEAARVDQVDSILLDQYADAVDAPDPIRLLRARGLAVEDTLTVAGCLLFAENPQRFFPEAHVRVLRYRGRERGTGTRQQLVRDLRIEGPIPRQLIDAQAAIAEMEPVRRALVGGGRFGPVPLVPRDAWLEGVVNAAIHRSYSIGGDHIRVEIFDDRIEIASPGRFPGIVDLAEPLGAPRFARNPRVARVCADLHFGQELGIRRIYREMRDAGLGDPGYRQTAESVRLVLSGEPVDRGLDARLSESARITVGALRTAGRLSTGEVAELLDVTPPTALKRLRALRSAGLVEWVGKASRDPRAYWTLPPT
ncbi:MAG TPA: ATP-binding protein [Solirubrobacteraceae bacterium]|nr:ATP-binding protein [Solirubrobacteraceae bacterium]